jgi:hypothetical protein
MRNRKAVVAAIILAICCFGQNAHGDDALIERWQSMQKTFEGQVDLPKSLEIHLTRRNVKGEVARTWVDDSQTLDYIKKGENFYWNCVTIRAPGGAKVDLGGTVLDFSDAGRMSDERSFNGVMYRARRDSDQNGQGDIIQARVPYEPVIDLPWQDLSLISLAQIKEVLDQGKLNLASIEESTLQGKPATKVTINYIDSGTECEEVWYDSAHGDAPVLSKEFHKDGSVYIETIDVKIATITANGTSYYIPIHGRQNWYEAGKIINYTEFNVDQSRLKVDQEIPDEQFVIQPRPADKIYDRDLQQWIWDPGVSHSDADVPPATQTSPPIQNDAVNPALIFLDRNAIYGVIFFVLAGGSVVIAWFIARRRPT